MRINVVTPGFTTPNGRAFLFPLLVWRRPLLDAGIAINIFDDVQTCGDADTIVVDSKYHRSRWLDNPSSIMDDFAELRRRCDQLVYCDTVDSTGGIQVELLPVVDAYWKFQLLSDRSKYMESMYGYRIYTDYYHRFEGVSDSEPAYSTVVSDPDHLKKLKVSWNSGLADYSQLGPLRMAAFQRLHCASLLKFPEASFTPISRSRPNEVSCRFGTEYSRDTVAWQRRKIAENLGQRLPTNKLSRRLYFRELMSSKVVISPFGLGEITLKDFEVFITGGLLIKPDMDHFDTWPPLFRKNETMICHSWNLDDLEVVLHESISNWREKKSIAELAQEEYRRYISSATGPELFVQHFSELLTDNSLQ